MFWYFYQDASLQLEVKLTGVISNGAALPGEEAPWGELVAPQVCGLIHQHLPPARRLKGRSSPGVTEQFDACGFQQSGTEQKRNGPRARAVLRARALAAAYRQ